MQNVVRKIVAQGKEDLCTELMNELKSLCKSDKSQINASVDAILSEMEKPHAQSRFVCLVLANDLFHRSSMFRSLLLSLRGFKLLELGLGTPETPLPPPFNWACKLERRTVAVVQEWHKKFGSVHPQLAILQDRLQDLLKNRRFLDQMEVQQAAPMEQSRTKVTHQLRLKKYLDFIAQGSMEKGLGKIKEHVSQLQSCLDILIPAVAGPQRDKGKQPLMQDTAITTGYRLE
ncbi:hypothetical protein HDU91_000638, partial [Kappamyces sp. JEL0680]